MVNLNSLWWLFAQSYNKYLVGLQILLYNLNLDQIPFQIGIIFKFV